MFVNFSKPIIEKLIQDEFTLNPSIEGCQTLNNETPAVILIKNQSPLCYVVFLFNTDILSETQIIKIATHTITQIKSELDLINSTRLISIIILPFETENQSVLNFVKKTSLFPDSKILWAWWAVDVNNAQITAGDGQPTEILDIRKKILNSMYSEQPEAEYNLAQIQKNVEKRTALPVKSKTVYVTYALILINIGLFAVMILSGQQEKMIVLFAEHSESILIRKEYYRLVTNLFLHKDFYHVGYNMLSLYIFGSRMETYFGKAYYICFYFLTGIGSSVASVFLTKEYSIGASGAVCGLIGGILALSFVRKKTINGLHYFTILMLLIMVLGIGLMDSTINNYAHFGGLTVGFFLAYISLSISKEPKY